MASGGNNLYVHARVTHDDWGKGFSAMNKSVGTFKSTVSSMKSVTANAISITSLTGNAGGFAPIISGLYQVSSAFTAVRQATKATQSSIMSFASAGVAGIATIAVSGVMYLYSTLDQLKAKYKEVEDMAARPSQLQENLNRLKPNDITERGKILQQELKAAWAEASEARNKSMEAAESWVSGYWGTRKDEVAMYDQQAQAAAGRASRLEKMIAAEKEIFKIEQATAATNKAASEAAKLKADNEERALKALKEADRILNGGVEAVVRRVDFSMPKFAGVSNDAIALQKQQLDIARQQLSALNRLNNNGPTSLPL